MTSNNIIGGAAKLMELSKHIPGGLSSQIPGDLLNITPSMKKKMLKEQAEQAIMLLPLPYRIIAKAGMFINQKIEDTTDNLTENAKLLYNIIIKDTTLNVYNCVTFIENKSTLNMYSSICNFLVTYYSIRLCENYDTLIDLKTSILDNCTIIYFINQKCYLI